jgi:hypothetical protein
MRQPTLQAIGSAVLNALATLVQTQQPATTKLAVLIFLATTAAVAQECPEGTVRVATGYGSYCQGSPVMSAKAITNQDIMGLIKAGLSVEIITAKIKSSTCDFDTSPVALAELRKANVPEALILAMVQAPPKKNVISSPPTGTPTDPTPAVVSTRPAVSVPPNMVRAIAYRVVPQSQTSYYQTGNYSSSSSCYGQGEWSSFGSFGNISTSTNCNTTYTSPSQIPITWRFADVYNAVESDDRVYLIGCRAAWRWSNCVPLIPGDLFSAEMSGSSMIVYGEKDGKKHVKVKYGILQVAPKQ